ncbi:MAG: hypothetical protein RL757_787 [Bacteroidota bacterium]|jgi:hypothetical protein
MKKIIVVLTLICSLYGCEQKTCRDDVDYGNLELTNAAKELNPYTSQNKIIVFKDSLAKEYKFALSNQTLQTSKNYIPAPCSEDASKMVNYVSKSDFFRLRLTGIELNMELYITIGPIPQPNQDGQTGEELNITNQNDNNLYHRINQKNKNGETISHTDNSFIVDSMKVLNKTFYQVIVNNPAGYNKSPTYRMGYNKTHGLVWFEDKSLRKTFVFDRIEN